ncbi:MAG: PAS domain S-box protein [candidate division KSB1 bacterium]|nr:PAS domain S-box protein [candidate division KSB1 bacterium]
MDKIYLLLADNEQAALKTAKRILEFHGDNFEVEFATSVKECLEKIFSHKYHILLLNYDLEGAKGFEVLDTIVQAGITLPVIMMVEEGREDIAIEALDRGACDYIMKVKGYLTALPFTIRKVIERKKISKDESSLPKEAKITTPIDAYYILDKRGRFLSANDKMENISGYSEDELLELSVIDLIPREQEQEFYQWIVGLDRNDSEKPFQSYIIGKQGQKNPVEIYLKAMKDDAGEIVGYQGRARDVTNKTTREFPTDGRIDQIRLINEMADAINSSLNGTMQLLLERIIGLACQLFKFKRATLALLDKRKRVFVKQAVIGYKTINSLESKIVEVPQEVIDKIFVNRFKVKVLYYSQDIKYDGQNPNNTFVLERRTQIRRPENQWHEQDLIILNLTDRNNKTFGYISLTEPVEGVIPSRDVFYNLEIFANLAALAIETFYKFSTLERRNRRLTQVLVTSNIFKLYLSLNELLKEVVWSIRFSLDFNLVALALISSKTGKLEIRAVACDDKIKLVQLEELTFPLNSFRELLKEKYKKSKSYLINEEEVAIRNLKDIYYGARFDRPREGDWSRWTLLLVPLKSRDNKITGFLLADDPVDWKLPDLDILRTLEILANQVSVAIDNRIMYLQLKKRVEILEKIAEDKLFRSTPSPESSALFE